MNLRNLVVEIAGATIALGNHKLKGNRVLLTIKPNKKNKPTPPKSKINPKLKVQQLSSK